MAVFVRIISCQLGLKVRLFHINLFFDWFTLNKQLTSISVLGGGASDSGQEFHPIPLTEKCVFSLIIKITFSLSLIFVGDLLPKSVFFVLF